MIMQFSGFDIIQLILLLISLTVFIQKPVPLYLKLFPVYLFFGLIDIIVIEYLQSRGRFNTGVANSWGIIEFCFYFFVLRELILNIKIKRVILFVIFLFPVFALINLYLQKQVGFNPVNFTIGSLMTVSVCLYYFVELFQRADSQSLTRLPAFWITTAILFNVVLTFPFFSFVSFMTKMPELVLKNILAIFYVINILTSTLYSIGFLCRIRIRKSTL
ncbi:MAG TPA: hypothetical protein VNW49_01880 [Puia sp.]|jgi:hypothetical protein|nr:hypothetical protein [Puia sp.]